ncbi:hypothetical protein B0T16DRAFT_461800 [Cercophora newfieldiana]|uniref:Uncharacterized protein n=1 Tax=Cercophora newfieldiana TaxID=92897 RepID=A0AA40CLE5_9PEZI|nr:hypothetical protein B0T16DRAFT_461800 [Cercophora newfieldiana]
MDTQDMAVDPPWGTQLGPHLPLPASSQHTTLISAFLNLDTLPTDLPLLTPTPSEISTILLPWRPQKLRRIAQQHIQGHGYHYIFLRTHYGGGESDSAKLRGWLDQGGWPNGVEIRPEDEYFVVLDDEELFDFGDDWQRVNMVLPEVAAPGADRRFGEGSVEELRGQFEEGGTGGSEDEEDLEDRIRVSATIGAVWLVVVDEEAFETGELGLMIRDKKGNVVKDSLIKAEGDAFDTFYLYCMVKGAYECTAEWGNGAVGRKYRSGGSIMRELKAQIKAKA